MTPRRLGPASRGDAGQQPVHVVGRVVVVDAGPHRAAAVAQAHRREVLVRVVVAGEHADTRRRRARPGRSAGDARPPGTTPSGSAAPGRQHGHRRRARASPSSSRSKQRRLVRVGGRHRRPAPAPAGRRPPSGVQRRPGGRPRRSRRPAARSSACRTRTGPAPCPATASACPAAAPPTAPGRRRTPRCAGPDHLYALVT